MLGAGSSSLNNCPDPEPVTLVIRGSMLERVGLHVWLVPGCFLDCLSPWLYAALSLIKYFQQGGAEKEGCGVRLPM